MTSLLFSADYLMREFGTVEPSAADRANHFFRLWIDWGKQGNSATLTTSQQAVAKQVCRTLGIMPFVEYQIRANHIRFKSPEFLAMFLIAIGD